MANNLLWPNDLQPIIWPMEVIFLKRIQFFYLFRRGVPSGVDCCENKMLCNDRNDATIATTCIAWRWRLLHASEAFRSLRDFGRLHRGNCLQVIFSHQFNSLPSKELWSMFRLFGTNCSAALWE